jgi:hypothetical protein
MHLKTDAMYTHVPDYTDDQNMHLQRRQTTSLKRKEREWKKKAGNKSEGQESEKQRKEGRKRERRKERGKEIPCSSLIQTIYAS